MDALFDETFGADTEVLVWTGSRTWRAGAVWTELARSPAPPETRSAMLKGVGRGLVVGGGAALVAGGVFGSLNFFEGVLPSTADRRQGAYEVGVAFAAGGAAVALSGVGVMLWGGRAELAAAPGGVLVAGRW